MRPETLPLLKLQSNNHGPGAGADMACGDQVGANSFAVKASQLRRWNWNRQDAQAHCVTIKNAYPDVVVEKLQGPSVYFLR